MVFDRNVALTVSSKRLVPRSLSGSRGIVIAHRERGATVVIVIPSATSIGADVSAGEHRTLHSAHLIDLLRGGKSSRSSRLLRPP